MREIAPEDMEIPEFTVHTLRHTFATRMLESGVDIYTLKELLGHSSVSVTEGYLHLCDRAKREKSLARIALGRGITAQGR